MISENRLKKCMFDYKIQGIKCVKKQNVENFMLQLREKAKNCKTKSEYVDFMKHFMQIDIEEVDDGIILHLHKEKCTCLNHECIKNCEADLCECTKAHEEYAWSLFFEKQIKVKIIESIFRDGNNCVIKLYI